MGGALCQSCDDSLTPVKAKAFIPPAQRLSYSMSFQPPREARPVHRSLPSAAAPELPVCSFLLVIVPLQCVISHARRQVSSGLRECPHQCPITSSRDGVSDAGLRHCGSLPSGERLITRFANWCGSIQAEDSDEATLRIAQLVHRIASRRKFASAPCDYSPFYEFREGIWINQLDNLL